MLTNYFFITLCQSLLRNTRIIHRDSCLMVVAAAVNFQMGVRWHIIYISLHAFNVLMPIILDHENATLLIDH